MAGQQRPGPTTPDPEHQANPFSPFFLVARHFAVLCLFATPVQVTRTRRITHRTHALFFFFFPLVFVSLRYVFTE